MSAIEKVAEMLRHEAESLKACHTLSDDWCGDPAEADYREMIAVADAAIAERAELLEALTALVRDSERVKEVMLREAGIGMIDEVGLDKARAAIARATGEQP